MLKKILFLILLIIFIPLVAFSEEISSVKINSINFDNSGNIVSLGTIGETEKLNISSKILSEPDRIYFDIEPAVLTMKNSSWFLKNNKIKEVRLAQNSTSPDVVRLVLFSEKAINKDDITLLKIKNSIILKFKDNINFNSSWSSFYKESVNTTDKILDKVVAVNDSEIKEKLETIYLQNTNKTEEEVVSQIQKAFNEKTQNIVNTTTKQIDNVINNLSTKKNSIFQSKFYIDKVEVAQCGLMIKGIGLLGMVKPMILTNPTRIVYDLPNTIIAPEYKNKEFQISSTDRVKIGQFTDTETRIVIYTNNVNNYRAVISPDLQNVFIATTQQLSKLVIANNVASITSYETKIVNKNTNSMTINFNSPIVSSINRNGNNIEIELYNVFKNNTAEFKKVLLSTNLGNVKVTEFANNPLKIVIPVKQGAICNLSMSLDGKALKYEVDEKNVVVKATPSKKNNYTHIVVIDAGHGGIDAGAIRENILEKDINLKVAQKVKNILNKSNIKVEMTRYEDKTVSLEERVDFANEKHADLFLSIHSNATIKTSVSGIETHWYRVESKNFADLLHEKVLDETKAIDRGIIKSQFYVINHTTMPAVLLEIGFLSNSSERELLLKESYQNKLARAIAESILKYIKK